MSTEIFVCTHKKFKYGLPFGYRILQVGASLNADLGYLRDDNGENISMKNHNYCELTGLYWVWKNVTSDYVGLVHYRRYFYKSRIAAVANDPLSVAYIEKQLKYYDIILPKKFKYNNTMREIYERDHNIEDYIFVVNEYHKEVKINDLNKKLKEEKDPLKQAKIIEEIMKLRGVNKNGTRN